MASTHVKELCIICHQTRIKSYLLHKCSTRGKYLHRKCATLTPGSQSLNYVKCIPTGNINNKEDKRDSTVKKQKNIGVSSALKGRTRINKKGTPSTNSSSLQARLSNSATLKPRRSDSKLRKLLRGQVLNLSDIAVVTSQLSGEIECGRIQ